MYENDTTTFILYQYNSYRGTIMYGTNGDKATLEWFATKYQQRRPQTKTGAKLFPSPAISKVSSL